MQTGQLASERLSAKEVRLAAQLRAEVAPVLAEAVVCALRDEPADAPGYLAEFLSAKGAGYAALVTEERKIAQECARLDVELNAVTEQLRAARVEATRRFPAGAAEQQTFQESQSDASWNEFRRLKRLIRSMKGKITEPLTAEDYAIPEGLIVVCDTRFMGVTRMCSTLRTDFGVTHLLAAADSEPPDAYVPDGTDAGDDPLGKAYRLLTPHRREDTPPTLLLHNWLRAHDARGQLEELSSRLGKPVAVLLFVCDELTLADRIETGSRETGKPVSRVEAERQASEWLRSDMPAIEAAARDSKITSLRVDTEGDFGHMMTNLLVACSSF